MGLKFKEIIVSKEISIAELNGKILAVDGMNILYQFLTTIRSADGSALTDSNGNVTSHLIGLFNRTTALMEQGLKLVFVFDGQPPEIKRKTWELRTKIKQQASLQLSQAKQLGNITEMKKFSSRTAVLTKGMVEEAEKVISALGLPIVKAPSEGEAQTAHMVKAGSAYASISQDYDNLIFGCPRLIKNLSITGKRKKAGTLSYQTVKPEMILLADVLKELQLDLDQLIFLAMLAGTDYNPGGIKGIGPKKALKLIKDKKNPESIFSEVNWNSQYPDLGWKELFKAIKEMPVTDNYRLEWKPPDAGKLTSLLVEQHEFNKERVNSKLEALQKEMKKYSQKGLQGFF
ncbi:MAG TPA: flap endonuclease-1 [Candidatus Nanoarchaeia archaeon]|nr:flap endonuclease-1 [Candidatus Nanoarchaeia archaeon]